MKFYLSVFLGKIKEQQSEQATVYFLDESIHNISEGCEFLDDGIRMKDQPFLYPKVEQSIAPGSPEDLW